MRVDGSRGGGSDERAPGAAKLIESSQKFTQRRRVVRSMDNRSSAMYV